MPAGLHPLGNNRVAAGLRRRQRLAERTNLPEGQRPAGVDALHHGGIRIAPEHIDDPGTASGKLKLLGSHRYVEGKETHSHRTVGARLDPTQLVTEGRRKGR